MSYADYDKLPKTSEEVYRLYADQKMGKMQNMQISSVGDNTEIRYTKTYTGGERVAQFFQGIGLTLGTFVVGLFVDRRIWNKFVATGDGEVEKKALVSNELFNQVVHEGKVVVPEQLSKDRTYEYAFAAEKKLSEGHTQEAIDMLLSIIKPNPKNAFVHGLLGEAYRQAAEKATSSLSTRTNLRLAKHYLEQSIELEPKNALALACLASLASVAPKKVESQAEAPIMPQTIEKISQQKQIEKKDDIVCQYSQGEIGKIREFLTSGPASDYVADEDIEKKMAQLGTFGGDRVGDDDMAQVIETLGSDLVGDQAAVACSVICLKAVESFFTSGIPKSEREMYQLISDGVDTYTTDYADEGLLDFGEVFTHSLREDVKSQIVNVIPALPYKMSEEYMQYLELGDIPTQVVSTHLDVLLEALQNTANETIGKTCAVLTTESTHATNATFVIMFDENKKPVLFNSHGETYKDKEQGASLLRFENMEALSKYVKDTFFKNEDGQFQLKILSTLS